MFLFVQGTKVFFSSKSHLSQWRRRQIADFFLWWCISEQRSLSQVVEWNCTAYQKKIGTSTKEEGCVSCFSLWSSHWLSFTSIYMSMIQSSLSQDDISFFLYSLFFFAFWAWKHLEIHIIGRSLCTALWKMLVGLTISLQMWKNGNELVTVSDLRCANRVVAARLHSHAHEYMEHMVESYLCSARERFEQFKNVSHFIFHEIDVFCINILN